jgi:hypothetical protein
MSPNAVSAKPRGASADTAISPHTSAQIPIAQLRPDWYPEVPTVQIVSFEEWAHSLLR